MGYGDTHELQTAQEQFNSTHPNKYKRNPRCTEYIKSDLHMNDEDYNKQEIQDQQLSSRIENG